MRETKPKGLTRDEEWAWDNTKPWSRQRRGIAWAKAREAQSKTTPWTSGYSEDFARQLRTTGRYVPPAHLTAEARARSPLYVRFGDAPEGGRSTTYLKEVTTGSMGHMAGALRHEREPGVCVFRARRDEDGGLVLDVSESPAVAVEAREFSRMGRPAYFAAGEEIGFGTGGEPCLKDPVLEPVPEGTRIGVSGERGALPGIVSMVNGVQHAFVALGAGMTRGA